MPAAVLWDMDGTIVDTEPYWMSVEIDLISAHGGTWSVEDGMQLVGLGLEDSAAIIQRQGVDLSIDDIVQTMTTRVLERVADEVPWRPGARELLREIADAGLPAGLVTMSLRRMATVVADHIGFDVFHTIVSGDDVANPKPHPEAYLTAADRLGVAIADCIAIEDSIPGLRSAIASGAVTVGVPLHAALEPGDTHTLLPTLEGVTLDHLAALVATRSAA